MEVVNKKLVLVVIIIGIISGIFIWQNISDKETKLEMVSLNNETKSSNMFAIMLEEIDEEGNSTYVESTDNMWPSLKYKYNTTNSGCLDVNGTSIPDILSYDSKNQKAIVRTKKVAYCYLYFDIDESVYAKVRNDYTDNNGALLLSETESDEYPVYYYNGNITNNNILYANFCWKMVRTTETGGVKLIYNGVPDEAEDGTLTCDNTGEESQIGTSAFNSSSNSPAYVGYMYNKIYKTTNRGFASNVYVGISKNMWGLYSYFSDVATWNGSEYELSNSDGSEVTTYKWSDNYTNLVGKYTCLSSNKTSCDVVSYIVGGNATWMDYYELSQGNDYNDYKIKLATSVTNNGDGTYTLVNPIEVIKADYANNYTNYKNYYYCGDLSSETCSNMHLPNSVANWSLTGYNMSNIYKYGNSFEYKDGKYILIDTIEFWNWPENYNTLNNNHYTCFNTTGECEQINYIFYTDSGSAFYITLSDGKSAENAINEMLYADDVNQINSTIKNKLDTWYENNIVGISDSNSNLYSSYLEDTIWCNNREITNLAGWNPNGGNIREHMGFDFDAFYCNNKTDQFTLKVEAGGTEGYGNNALDYPIGALTKKEVDLASRSGYLKLDSDYWLISPRSYFNWGAYADAVFASNYMNMYVNNIKGIRPSLSLSNKVEILAGSGSVETPYQVILFN